MDDKDNTESGLSKILARINEIDQRIGRLEGSNSSEMEKLSSHITHLEDIGRVQHDVDSKVQQLRKEIQAEGERVKRNIVGSIGLLAAVLSLLGFFGFKYYAEASFKRIYEHEIKDALGKTKTDADDHLNTIKNLKDSAVTNFEALQHNRLVVLQTDFGVTGHLVGQLKSLIYNSNPQARIDTITQNISKFSVREASVVLWRAVKHFPDETIFLAITDSGEHHYQAIAVKTENPVPLLCRPLQRHVRPGPQRNRRRPVSNRAH